MIPLVCLLVNIVRYIASQICTQLVYVNLLSGHCLVVSARQLARFLVIATCIAVCSTVELFLATYGVMQ